MRLHRALPKKTSFGNGTFLFFFFGTPTAQISKESFQPFAYFRNSGGNKNHLFAVSFILFLFVSHRTATSASSDPSDRKEEREREQVFVSTRVLQANTTVTGGGRTRQKKNQLTDCASSNDLLYTQSLAAEEIKVRVPATTRLVRPWFKEKNQTVAGKQMKNQGKNIFFCQSDLFRLSA